MKTILIDGVKQPAPEVYKQLMNPTTDWTAAMNPTELIATRAELGVTHIQFARVLDVSTRTLRAWEADGPSHWPVPHAVAVLIRLAREYPHIRRKLGIDAAKAADKGAPAKA